MNQHYVKTVIGAALVSACCVWTPVKAASCDIGTLDASKLAAAYQGAAQHLGQLYNLGRSLRDADVVLSLQAQGPLSSFGDATYLVSDLLKLRSTLTNDHDRGLVDADIRANLQMAGPSFQAGAAYLANLAPRAVSPDLGQAITAARQQILDGVNLYGACAPSGPPPGMPAPPAPPAPSASPAPPPSR